jgi:peptidoglycan/xylan/chitin deacetylase (PgdA/CDA1 family)
VTGGGLTLGPAWVQSVKPALTRARTVAWRRRGARAAASAGLRILFYHRISDDRDPLAVSPGRFAEHMATLRADGYEVVDVVTGAQRLASGASVERLLGLCFDDGYRDVAEHAVPALERHGMRATVFVATGVAGGRARFEWYARQPPVLGWPEIAALDRGSPLRFEAHTVTHPNLLRLDADAARREIEGSKAELEDRLGRPIAAFCYPGGCFAPRERELVARAGFDFATTCEPGANRPDTDPLALRRLPVDALDRAADVRAKAEGGFDRPLAVRTAYRRARGLAA